MKVKMRFHHDNGVSFVLCFRNAVFGTQSLLAQWTDSYRNGDYDEDPYDDDMYEGQDLSKEIQTICDKLDIRVRGPRMKKYADKKRRDLSFASGDYEFVKLHSYRQHSVKLQKNQNLGPLIHPIEILDSHRILVKDEWEIQVLVHWDGQEEHTWESWHQIQQHYPNIDLKDKVCFDEGRNVILLPLIKGAKENIVSHDGKCNTPKNHTTQRNTTWGVTS
ncbi:hypothetical protein Tco_0921277 [Tanacetum coccineum]